MTKPHTCFPSLASSKLGILRGRGSHMMSKLKPKIKVIHIYAPEIIQTDAANFRDLVQRLTGKPEDNNKIPPAKDLMEKEEEEEEEEFLGLQNGKRIKNEDKEDEEDEMWRRSKSYERFSCFFDGFSELDGFMEELSTMN